VSSFRSAEGQLCPVLRSFAPQAKARAPTVRVAFSTFAGNREMSATGVNHGAIDVILQQYAHLAIYSSVLVDSPYMVTAYSAYDDDCVAVPLGSGDPYGSQTRMLYTDAPGFNNAAAGDYRLRSESVLNDYCDALHFAPGYRDLVLTPRCHDDPRKPDVYGTCDAGAYESDHIFGNGFE